MSKDGLLWTFSIRHCFHKKKKKKNFYVCRRKHRIIDFILKMSFFIVKVLIPNMNYFHNTGLVGSHHRGRTK